MSKDSIDTRLQLDTPERIDFANHVLRVLRYVIATIQLEKRKQWSSQDLIDLLDKMMLEIAQGITEEDKIREHRLRMGLHAFKQGMSRDKNPYPTDSQEHSWWDTGWRDGERAAKKAQLKPVPEIAAEHRQKPRCYYRVQLQDQSGTVEWSAALHMYVAAGGGTLYDDYDEAESLTRHLQQMAKTGVVSLLVVEANTEKN
ncbi:ribosome modulation factor [Thioflexithrix psekupsensis]|uniref:Uncharacterized protein n=1 Tax=Thioflexithrix psekupsensis TaxID=1570016 RepID=A0A251X9V0_9GAMM|nr:hypothetical protein [Thioflexithrix psekupsensis]OUD14453.1 hypothetical protein TPSD3_09110 [Thioflexithrix psekupsensis]